MSFLDMPSRSCTQDPPKNSQEQNHWKLNSCGTTARPSEKGAPRQSKSSLSLSFSKMDTHNVNMKISVMLILQEPATTRDKTIETTCQGGRRLSPGCLCEHALMVVEAPCHVMFTMHMFLSQLVIFSLPYAGDGCLLKPHGKPRFNCSSLLQDLASADGH